jgi:hypothetical protein
MKKTTPTRQPAQLTSESQRRLIAYSTAAGLGAFFGGHNALGQVTESKGLAPYPRVMVTQITNSFDIDGDGVNDFRFAFVGKAISERLPIKYPNASYAASDTNNCLLYGVAHGGKSQNWALNPPDSQGTVPPPSKKDAPMAYAYPIPWTVGSIIDSNAWKPAYQAYGAQLADGWHNNFQTNGALGFTFVSTKSGKPERYYGYMDIQVTGSSTNPGFTAIVKDMYYNAKPNAGITVGAAPASSAK